ncbi:hypothetical protein [Aurantiacibacter aquimixticola]|nr:hypothetical protein [Aurantiacibacter aquimixticola]
MTDQTRFDRFSMPGDIPDGRNPLTGETPEEKLQRVLDEHGYYLKVPVVDPERGNANAHPDDLSVPQAPGADIRPLGSSQELGRPVGLASAAPRSPELATGAAVGHATGEGSKPQEHPTPAPAPRTFGSTEALTGARMADFLVSMQTLGNVSIACKRAGIARQTAYRARRRHPGFARAWDAALVAARTVAESELAERAIHGVEETVYYHGEEVGSRRRYDARLLLAHLARLDKAAERLDVAASLPQLDDWIDALRDGADADAVMPERVDAEALREAQDARDLIADPRGFAEAEAARAEARKRAGEGADADLPQDTVTPVTPCPDCGGLCTDAEEDEAVHLTSDDCMWLGNRLERMDAARPAGAPKPHEQPGGDPDGDLEMVQMAAFEAGEDAWWTLTLAELEEGDTEVPGLEGSGSAGSR